MSTRRKVLVVTPDLPYPPSWGFGMRVYQLVRALAEAHDVTLLCGARPDQADDVAALRTFCSDVRVVVRQPLSALRRRTAQAASLFSTRPYHASAVGGPALQAALDACLAEGDVDVVQVESSQLMTLRYDTRATLVLDEHNIESELLTRMQQTEGSRLRRAYNRLEAAKYRALEARAWSRADLCLVTSEREATLLGRRAPGLATLVVPNGVDPAVFEPGPPVTDSTGIVFTGLLTYRPNLDAVRWFVDEVLPLLQARRPDARLTVVGYGAPEDLAELRAPGVAVTGWVPDVRPYLAAAACVVVPVRMGGGTRLKVLEALSMGKAVVSTTLGCEGLDVVDDEHLLVADAARDVADRIVAVLEDRDLRERLGRAGRELVTRAYSWQRSGGLLTRALLDTTTGTARAAS